MKTVKLDEWMRSLEARKAKLGLTGNDYVRPNSGERRTPQKRRLLEELERIAREAGRRPPFAANK